MPGKLYLVATPIGNLEDITYRAVRVLGEVELIACEDTRQTRKLLYHYGIAKPTISYHDHNEAQRAAELAQRMQSGASVALVSDAGMPLVSDPGYRLVQAAIEAGIPVEPLPGPSAALAALTVSGLPSDRFLFAGFLPSRKGERRSALEELASVRATLIFFESAQRLAETLADMVEILGVRSAAVAREMTKLHEEVRRGLLADLASHYARHGAPKGEVTLVVSPPHPKASDPARLDWALAKAMAQLPLRSAVDLVAELLDEPRRGVYERALALKDHG